MIKLNKKAAANAGTSTTAKVQYHIAQILKSLSDFFVSLYRYFRLKKIYKGSIAVCIETLYKEQLKDNDIKINIV